MPDSAGRRTRTVSGELASPGPSSYAAMQLARRRGLRPVLPRIVPWRDWSEWEQVRAGLLGAEATAAVRAIRRVRAWQSRCKVPHSVEATAALVEIKLASARVSAPRDAVRSDNELRLMYAMAIVRLVNGIVDAVQQKKFAAPVSDLADSIALPSVLVDIRHAASHNALPSLPALSQAADRALEWLRRHYWEPQAAVLTPPEQTVEPLLREYVRVRSRQLAASDALSDASDPPATSAGGGSGSKGGRKKETKADKEAMLKEAEATEHKARAREEKHAKRQATADDLLARLLAATPALDLVPALVEPMIAMTWQILKDSLSDFGLVRHHICTHMRARAHTHTHMHACRQRLAERLWTDAAPGTCRGRVASIIYAGWADGA